jgi:hypothetical protein
MSKWGWGATWLKKDNSSKQEQESSGTVQTSESTSSSLQPPTSQPQHPPSPKSQSPQKKGTKKTKGGKKNGTKASGAKAKKTKTKIAAAESDITAGVTTTQQLTDESQSKVSINGLLRRTFSQQSASSSLNPDLETDMGLESKRRREALLQEIAWYEDDLRERRDICTDVLNDNDLRALEYFDRLSAGSLHTSLPLNDDEIDELFHLSEERKQVQRDEAEMEVLLERQGVGEEIDLDRLRYLALLSRQRLGETLSNEDDAFLYYTDIEERDEEDLVDMLLKKENGEEIDESMLFELQLLSRKRNGDETMTDEEFRDVELLLCRREDARLDQIEYRELLRLKESGEEIDEDRLYILSLLDRHLRNDLTEDEANDVNEYFANRDEEHLDGIELSILLDKKENGLPVDEERLYELELLHRKRLGDQLATEEEEDLVVFFERRKIIMKEAQELNELITRKESGEIIDEDRLRELQLLDCRRQGSELSPTEEEELQLLSETREIAEKEADELRLREIEVECKELDELLNRKGLGQDIDEARLYELQLRERQRQGVELTDDEFTDLELFEMQRAEGGICGNESENFADAKGKYDDGSLASLRETNLTSSERDEIQNIDRQREEHGLPLSISWSSPLSMREKFDMSFVSHGDNSYLQDLLNQKERRDEEHNEECLEEALELYQVAVKQKKLPEDEQLFLSIMAELKKEKKGEWVLQNKKIDALLKLEIEQNKQQKNSWPDTGHFHDAHAYAKAVARIEAEEGAYSVETLTFLGHKESLSPPRDLKVISHSTQVAEAFGADYNENVEKKEWGVEAQAIQKCCEGSSEQVQAGAESAKANDNPRDAEEGDGFAKESLAETEIVTATAKRLAKTEEMRNREQIEVEEAKLSTHIDADAIESSKEVETQEMHCRKFVIAGSFGQTSFESDIEAKSNDVPRHPQECNQSTIPSVDKELECRENDEEAGHVAMEIYENASAKPREKRSLFQEKNVRRQAVENLLTRLEQDGLDSLSGRALEFMSAMEPDQKAPGICLKEEQESQDHKTDQVIALTDGEISELSDLLDAQEQGLMVDEERLYELEILDRFSLGDDLSSEELDDLNVILRRRERFQSHTKEYNDLLDKQEAGQEVDMDRLYLLELVVRERLGEELSPNELQQLREFYEMEGEAIATVEDSNHLSLTSGTLLSGQPLTLLEEVDEEAISESDTSVSGDPSQGSDVGNQDCKVPRGQTEEYGSHVWKQLFRNQQKPLDTDNPTETCVSGQTDEVANASDFRNSITLFGPLTVSGVEDRHCNQIQAINVTNDSKTWGDKSELIEVAVKPDDDTALSVEQKSLFPYDLQAAATDAQAFTANDNQSENSSTDASEYIGKAQKKDILAENVEIFCGDTGSASSASKSLDDTLMGQDRPDDQDKTLPNLGAASTQNLSLSSKLLHTPGGNGFSSCFSIASEKLESGEGLNAKSNGNPENTSPRMHNLLSEEEQRVLRELMSLKETGGDFDKDKLYELDLLRRFSAGESLTPMELEDVDFIVEGRKRQGRYREEFESLEAKKKEGESINTERFYFLELLERHRLGLSLTDEEIADIEVFEADEEASNSEDEPGHEQEPEPSNAMNTTEFQSSENSTAAQARLQAMALLQSSNQACLPACSIEVVKGCDVQELSRLSLGMKLQEPILRNESPQPTSDEETVNSADSLVKPEVLEISLSTEMRLRAHGESNSTFCEKKSPSAEAVETPDLIPHLQLPQAEGVIIGACNDATSSDKSSERSHVEKDTKTNSESTAWNIKSFFGLSPENPAKADAIGKISSQTMDANNLVPLATPLSDNLSCNSNTTKPDELVCDDLGSLTSDHVSERGREILTDVKEQKASPPSNQPTYTNNESFLPGCWEQTTDCQILAVVFHPQEQDPAVAGSGEIKHLTWHTAANDLDGDHIIKSSSSTDVLGLRKCKSSFESHLSGGGTEDEMLQEAQISHFVAEETTEVAFAEKSHTFAKSHSQTAFESLFDEEGMKPNPECNEDGQAINECLASISSSSVPLAITVDYDEEVTKGRSTVDAIHGCPQQDPAQTAGGTAASSFPKLDSLEQIGINTNDTTNEGQISGDVPDHESYHDKELQQSETDDDDNNQNVSTVEAQVCKSEQSKGSDLQEQADTNDDETNQGADVHDQECDHVKEPVMSRQTCSNDDVTIQSSLVAGGDARDFECDQHAVMAAAIVDLSHISVLLERENTGEELTQDEIFELDLLLKQEEGVELSQDELDSLAILIKRRKIEAQDMEELESMKRKASKGERIDEERFHELELFQLYRDGAELTNDELFELEALSHLQSGKALSTEEMHDLEILREERLRDRLLRKELAQLRTEKKSGSPVDKERLFELEIRDKIRLGEELLDEEVYALELFEKIESGEELTEIERCDLKVLSGQYEIVDSDGQHTDMDDLYDSVPQDRNEYDMHMDDHGTSQAKYAEDPTTSEDKNSNVSQQTDPSLLLPIDLQTLQNRRKNGLDYDEDLLYELELFEVRDQGVVLGEDELFEIQMFEKSMEGVSLTPEEVKAMQLLRLRRIKRRVDKEELFALQKQREEGKEIDDDLLYELELFEKMRAQDPLTEDERFEIEMFQLIRDGNVLTDNQIQELEFLKAEREEAALDTQDLQLLRELKHQGNPVDEEFLYELELFQRKRDGLILSEDEKAELLFFQRQRNGENLQEDDLDELEMLRRRRMNHCRGFETDLILSCDGTPDDEDSIYRRKLLDRQMKGQRLDKQEFIWLEILKKKKRKEELLEDELDELDVMRRQRKEANIEVEVKQTRKLLEMEMERKMKRELKEQRRREKEERRLLRRIEKEEMREQKRREKQHERMLRERRAKVKKMRKRKKEAPIDRGGSRAATPPVQAEDQKSVSVSEKAVEIVDLPTFPQQQKEEAKKSLFGGVFGARNKKKEEELEEARRRQEELIKEQMKALALESELKELEKEKELQRELVKETVEKLSTESIGASSWETASGVGSERSKDEESSVISSSEESDSESDSENSSISEDSFGVASATELGGKPSIVSGAERRMSQKCNKRLGQRQEMNSRLRESLQRRQARICDFNASAITESRKTGLEFTVEKLSTTVVKSKDKDDNSVVSHDSREQSSDKYRDVETSDDKNRSSKSKSKTISLSAHLRKKNKKRSSKKNKARYGDDISLGTLQLPKIATSNKGVNDTKALKSDPLGINEKGRAVEKMSRPWIVEEDTMDLEQVDVAPEPRNEEMKKPSSADVENIFNSENQHVFERSVFNFNQSFRSKLSLVQEDEGSQSNMSLSESESVASATLARGAEFNTDIDNASLINDEMSLVESLTSSFVSLTEEKFIFETPDYENIESRLAEKLRHKEAEFDAAWENIVADENVAAQINQRLKERQRTKGSEKKEKKEEPTGLYDVPRLFLFEGEKLDTKMRKKTTRKRKKKDRKLQKKLDRTLSREFRRAMREVFNSDSEEEYDKTFGDEDENLQSTVKPGTQSLFRDSSDHSMNESGSIASEESDKLDHRAYMARLRDRSMQQKVRKDLYESRRQLNAASMHSEMSSDDDDFSQNSELSHYDQSRGTIAKDSAEHHKGKRIKKNRNGELIGEEIDPADVYAKELEKQKVKKAFTIADLRKEMEDLKQANLGLASMEAAITSTKKVKTTKLKKPKNSVSMAGPESLTPQRPGLGNKVQSFTTAATELGLLSGGKTSGFGPQPETIPEDDDDDEDAFLTGGRETSGDFGDEEDGGFNDSKASSGFGFRGAGLSNFSFFGTSGFKSPSKVKKKPAHSSKSGMFAGAGSTSQHGGFGSDDLPGPPVVSPGGFQEPLPVPETQDESNEANRRSSMFGTMGKSSKRFISKFKLPLKRTASTNHGGGGGFMLDDEEDQFEGGMGLLG